MWDVETNEQASTKTTATGARAMSRDVRKLGYAPVALARPIAGKSPRRGALRRRLVDEERGAGAHEEAVALGPAKGEVGADFGEADAAEQLALLAEAQHARIAERR